MGIRFANPRDSRSITTAGKTHTRGPGVGAAKARLVTHQTAEPSAVHVDDATYPLVKRDHM